MFAIRAWDIGSKRTEFECARDDIADAIVAEGIAALLQLDRKLGQQLAYGADEWTGICPTLD